MLEIRPITIDEIQAKDEQIKTLKLRIALLEMELTAYKNAITAVNALADLHKAKIE